MLPQKQSHMIFPWLPRAARPPDRQENMDAQAAFAATSCRTQLFILTCRMSSAERLPSTSKFSRSCSPASAPLVRSSRGRRGSRSPMLDRSFMCGGTASGEPSPKRAPSRRTAAGRLASEGAELLAHSFNPEEVPVVLQIRQHDQGMPLRPLQLRVCQKLTLGLTNFSRVDFLLPLREPSLSGLSEETCIGWPVLQPRLRPLSRRP